MKLSGMTVAGGMLIVVLLLCGCHREPAGTQAAAGAVPVRSVGERIAGSWQGSMLLNDEAVAGKIPPENLAELEAMQMGMEFREGGVLVLTGVHNGQPYTSRNQWKLLRESAEEATILSIEPSGAQKEIVLVFEGEDVFLLPVQTEVAELGAMRFERLR